MINERIPVRPDDVPEELNYIRLGGGVFLLFLGFAYYDFRMNCGAQYNEGQVVYAALPRGMDFKAVYVCADALWRGLGEYLRLTSTGYPPLVTVLYLPLRLFSADLAYRLFVFILMLCGAATVHMSMVILRPWSSLVSVNGIVNSIGIYILLTFTYPFNFSFERGNSDIIAALFAAGAVFATARGRKWPAVLLLTISSQIKIYPAILSVLLLMRFGWGSIIGFISLNIGCLFILGPDAFLSFLGGSRRLSTMVFSWPGNHSFHSYVVNLYKAGLFSKPLAERLIALAYLLSAGSFAALFTRHIRSFPWRRNNNNFSAQSIGPREIGIVGVCFCLMSLLPPTSHDYKLVIHIVPFLILLSSRVGWLFSNEMESRCVITVVSLLTAFLYVPRFEIMPLRVLCGGLPAGEMKTPALVMLCVSYGYLAMRGHASDCEARSL
jgi:hypothetical protein